MENQIFRDINTGLDLNGPILSIVQQPEDVTGIGTTSGSTGGGSVELIGIATATFTGIASNQGTLAYQWYKQGVGALSDSTNITGTATTTLSFTNLITPSDQASYYFTADYVPTYSGVGDPRLGSGYRTGNAPNEPIQSENAIINVTPLIEIISEPLSFQTTVDSNATFNVISRLSDSRYTDDLQYQWVVDGVEVNDGRFILGEGGVSTQTVEQTFVADGTITIPNTATDVRITLASGSGGNGGTAGAENNPDVVEGYWGLGGAGRIGIFRLLSTAVQRTLSFRIGMQANDGSSGNTNNSGDPNNQIGNWDANTNSPGQGGGLGGDSTFVPGGNGGPSAFITATAWGGGGGGGGGATTLRDPAIVVEPSHDYMAIAGAGGGAAGGIINAGSTGGASGGSVTARGTITGDGLSFIYGEMDSLITSWSGSPGGQNLAGGGTGGGGGGSQIPYFSVVNTPNPNPFPGSAGNEGFIGGAGGVIHEPGSAVSYPGNAGISAYDTTQLELLSESTNIGNGYAHVSYVGEGDPVGRDMTILGSKTPTLTISSDTVGVSTVRCKISSATASNSPLYTNIVNFAVLSTIESANINIEEIIAQETSANLVDINLVNGVYTFSASSNTGLQPHTYVLYAPDRDIDVVMDLYGGKGPERPWSDAPHPDIIMGGFGGYSRIRFTMKQNTEYVISGLIPEVNTPFIYEKARLIACVGEGGHPPFQGGTNCGSGGKGGGCGLPGSTGGVTGLNDTRQGENLTQYSDPSNCDSGVGGASLQRQQSDVGIFGSAIGNVGNLQGGDTQAEGRNGGRTIQCTKGIYWAQQGIDACDDLEIQEKFRLADGTEVTNTSDIITRGFKAGYNVMQTAGAGARGVPNTAMWEEERVGGRGGNGAYGGEGGASTSAGGGGAGFWLEDYGITVLDAVTGGSEFNNARVVLRRWTPEVES